MKKIFFIITILIIITKTQVLAATTPTPSTAKSTPTPSIATTPESDDLDRIQKIKDLVASRVAELKLVEKRGILGTVKEVNGIQIIITNSNQDQKTVDIDELTKFQKDGDTKSFGISDIKKGDNLSFIGLYNKDTKRLLARFIAKASNIPVYFEGIVSEKDTKNFILNVINEENEKRLIDVQSSTKTSSHDVETQTIKSGFTKIQTGERIIIAGFTDLKNKDTINASRIIHFKSLPPSSKMKTLTQTQPDEENAAASESGLQIQTAR